MRGHPRYEMELASATQEDDPTGGSRGGLGAAVTRAPIENPAIDPIPNDPLLEPHPAEPGVSADGTAAPLENPDDSVSADPLVAGR
jgi:hypothetical protein